MFKSASGTKLIDQVGRNPNFSPSARFVAAFVGNVDANSGGKMILFDLLGGRPVDFKIEGPIIGWALEDGILIEGTYPRGQLKIRQSLIDPQPQPAAPKQIGDDQENNQESEAGLIVPRAGVFNRGASAWEALRFKLEIERGLVVLVNQAGAARLWELATGYSIPVNAKQPTPILEHYGLTNFRAPTTWDTGEPLRLSHYSPELDRVLGNLFGNKKFPKQKAFFFQQNEITEQSQERSRKVGGDWRAKSIWIGDVLATTRENGFENQIATYGILLDEFVQPEALVLGTTWDAKSAFEIGHRPIFKNPRGSAGIEKRLLASVPIAGKYLNTRGKSQPLCTQLADDRESAWSIRDQAHGIWTWSDKNKTYWLVQMLCFWKGALSTKVYLFVNQGREAPTVVDLFDPLTELLGDVTNELLTRIRPYVIGKNWLMLGSAGGAAIALVNLTDTKNVLYLHNLRSASAMKQIFLSKDRRFAVQLNTDGSFYVYSMKGASVWNVDRVKERNNATSPLVRFPIAPVVVSGRWIDDEILFYTDQGYYWGSYEAGQFVHLMQSGEIGLHPISQFASLLSRPDIVRAAIEGTSPPPAPQLNVPPQFNLELGAVSNGKVEISIDAQSTTQLKLARLFIDGKPLPDIKLENAKSQKRLTITLPSQTHWLSGVVIDQAGLTGTPVTVRLERNGPPTGRLIGMLIGIDEYAEPNLKLNFASQDAKRLRDVLNVGLSSQYTSVDLLPLLNSDAKRVNIERELEKIVERVGEDDTLLFFFSGHGFNDKAGRYYLVPSDFLSTNLAGTGLEWSRIGAILKKSKGRIVVILDACHSGQSGAEESANDQVPDAFSEIKVPMVILAAAKGRQFAYEDTPNKAEKWGGGAFTFALKNLLSSGRAVADTNHNGALEISEIYSALKTAVTKDTANNSRGVQTPWLEQRNVVGDFALF